MATTPVNDKPGPFQSSVVTADKSATPSQEALVEFDDLPPNLQQQVIDILEQNKENKPVVEKDQPAENPSQQLIEFKIPDNGPSSDPSKPLVAELVLRVEDGSPVETKPNSETVLHVPVDETGNPIKDNTYVFDTSQLPADVREDAIRQWNLSPISPAIDEAQQREIESQQSLEKLAGGVADVLARLAASDPYGEQGIDFNELPPEIRAELSNYLAKEVDKKAEQVKDQDNQKQSGGLQTAAAVGGGLLGGLIAGATGGYPGKFIDCIILLNLIANIYIVLLQVVILVVIQVVAIQVADTPVVDTLVVDTQADTQADTQVDTLAEAILVS